MIVQPASAGAPFCTLRVTNGGLAGWPLMLAGWSMELLLAVGNGRRGFGGGQHCCLRVCNGQRGSSKPAHRRGSASARGRKSVGEGKGVTGRLKLGGVRIIYKKKN